MSAPLENLLRDARVDLVMSRLEKDPSIINEVMKHLDSTIRSIKFNSILVLGELGTKSEQGIPRLINLLDDDDWSICREAVRSLGKMGNIAKDAIPKLSKLLERKEVTIRKEAAFTLGKIGNATNEALSGLIKACNDENEEVRTEAARSFGEFGSAAQGAIPQLMKCLKDVDWTVRTASAESISKIGKESTVAIPKLIIALEDKDWRVQYRIINTLAEIGAESIPSLVEVLEHKNKNVRKGAIDALSEMKISDPKIIKNISLLLNDKVERVRGKAADALRSIGKDALPALIGALESANTKMKILIISAIGGIGKEANQAIPIIIDFLKNPDQQKVYSKSFGASLKRALTAFIQDPTSKKATIRVEAARSLGRIGFDSEDAIHSLEKALNDPKKVVRRESALSVGKLGLPAKIVIPSLIKALDDKNPEVRWRSSEALGVIGVGTEDVISSLNNLVHDEVVYVSESATVALDKLAEQ